MGKIIRLAAYVLYYGFAYYLPENHWVGGNLWNAIRVACARRLLRECGQDVHIDRCVNFGSGNKFSLKDHAGIGANSRVIGDVTFGEWVATAFDIIVTAYDRKLDDTSVPMLHHHEGFDAPVVIGRDCVLFARVIVLPGVHVGEGSIVAAGGVVNRNIASYCVVGGNPARVVKWRRPPGPEAFAPRMTPIECAVPAESRAFQEEAQRKAHEYRAAKQAATAAASE